MPWPWLTPAVTLALASAPVSAVNPGGFPNAITAPLRGWRSWNGVFSDVTQDFITRQVDAIAARRHLVAGVPTSLADLGYDRVGIDSGWASCTGVNGSWHDSDGHFIINTTKAWHRRQSSTNVAVPSTMSWYPDPQFPGMKAMVDHAHSAGVKMGFYLNQDLDPAWHNCRSEGQIHGAAANTGNYRSYKNDIVDMVALGFDAVKFDSVVSRPLVLGGGNDDMNRWAEEINATGREVMIENCNNGGYVPYKPPAHPAPAIHEAVPGNCPFNMFRTGIDNAPSPLSMVSNLMDTSSSRPYLRCTFVAPFASAHATVHNQVSAGVEARLLGVP
eukprot:gene4763-4933_t